MIDLKKVRNIFIIAAFLVISYAVGYHFGDRQIKNAIPKVSFFNWGSGGNDKIADFSLFWDVWGRLTRSYVNKSDLNPTKMLYGAISGMVASTGDPYTVFLNPQQNKDTKEELGGTFDGIGAQLGLKDNKIVVIAPISQTPAEKAGIKAGDFILAVDGRSTDKLTLPEVVSKIRGQKGTKVKLTLAHENANKPIELSITRDTIYVKSVELTVKENKKTLGTTGASGNTNVNGNGNTPSAKEKDKYIAQNKKGEKVIYLKLSRFGDGTDTEWDNAVTEIIQKLANDKNIKGMVLDLRNNPGGYLNGAVYIASEFLKSGVVVQQESVGKGRETFSIDHAGRLLEVPLVILVNRGSASASEIVAGSLSEHKRAKLLGEKTFGKGSIQEVQELPEGAGLHITIAKWLLPSGKWINGVGIEPDIKVAMDEKHPDLDPQIDRAIEELTK